MGRPGPSPLHACVLMLMAIAVVASGCRTAPDRRERQRAFEAKQAKIERKDPRGWRRRNKPRMSTPKIEAFQALGQDVGASAVDIMAACLDRQCSRRALGRLFQKLDRIEERGQGVARILLLGDSHVAGDYIARAVRNRLQHRFGNAGRGFVAVDQKSQYGGRRLKKSNWTRTRIVDGDGPGKAYGFSGMRLDSTKSGAEIVYELEPFDDDVVAYFLGQPDSSTLNVYVHDKRVGRIRTLARNAVSRTRRVPIPESVDNRSGTPRRLRIVAKGPGTSLFGLSFESYEAGVILDAVGPVGADAKTYLQMDERSFREHLQELDPDLIMLMVGGNDALAVRKRQRTLAEVEKHHLLLVDRIRKALPDSDCLLWAPLDAGIKADDGEIRSKPDLPRIRDIQRHVAEEMKCAFWDTYEAMGGSGSFSRWYERGLMNRDLIHPRAKGGDLLGHLFATALINAYLNGS